MTNCRRRYLTQYQNYRCENAMVSCLIAKPTWDFPCKGAWNIDNETYICKAANYVFPNLRNASRNITDWAQPFTLNKQVATCKKARGAEWQRDDWFPYMVRDLKSLDEAYAAMYAAGSETRTVKILKRRSFTRIQPFWFAVFSLKVAMILILGGIVLALRKWKGYERVANDEFGLGSLLFTSTTPLDELTCDERSASDVPRSNVYVEMQEETVRIREDITVESELIKL